MRQCARGVTRRYRNAGGLIRGSGGTGLPDHAALEVAERLAQLTPQQFRVFSKLCSGRLNKQIAYELQITEATVKAHMTAIMRKLGAANRTLSSTARRAPHPESGRDQSSTGRA